VPRRPATTGHFCWATPVAAACTLLGVRASAGQTTATVDLGVSSVHYDGFLPSGATAITPALRWTRPTVSLSARGTYLRFASGNRSLQGTLAGSLLMPSAAGRWRTELDGSLGASSYRDFARFWHAVSEARLHWLGTDRGAWVGGAVGRTSYGAGARPVVTLSAGAWARRPNLTVALWTSRAHIGDTVYTDLESSAHGEQGALALDASLGARVASRGGGHGMFAEGSATLALGERMAGVVSAGRYPTDAISGTISGRYVTVALRVRTAAPRRFLARDLRRSPTPREGAADSGTLGPAPELAVTGARAGHVRLLVRVADASQVEIAGDFTDWQPVALTGAAPGVWEAVFDLASGVHRLNVRVDGGAWRAPAGTTRAPDDYGGTVGLFVVP
jgi:hypothetical protein